MIQTAFLNPQIKKDELNHIHLKRNLQSYSNHKTEVKMNLMKFINSKEAHSISFRISI